MSTTALNEADVNAMILDLMGDEKKKKSLNLIKGNKKKNKKMKMQTKHSEKDKTEYKEQIKNNLSLFLKEQQSIYRNEEISIENFIKLQIEEKEKELNGFYEYCQNFKKDYKENFNDVMKNSEEIKKELKDLHIEYLDNKIQLENKRRNELKEASDFYKEKLLEVKNQWEAKAHCDDNLKALIFDILNVMD